MQPVLLLHGAIGSMDQFNDLEKKLAASFIVHRLNFSGHGGSSFMAEQFSIKLFAEEVIRYLNEKEIENIHVFGYSMGGYVAIYLARFHPHRVNKIITLATKFKWDEAIAAKEMNMLSAKKIEEKIPAFAHSLQTRHAPNNWKTVLEKTANMLYEMGKDNPLKIADFAQIHNSVLLMLGDRDKMVTLDETLDIFKNMLHAHLAVLPNTPHPIEMVNTDRLVFEIRSFIA